MKTKKLNKCLILCMGCNNDYYLQQFEDIKNTWGKSIINGEMPDIDIIMYTSSGTNEYAYDKEKHILYVPCNDSLCGTFEKTMKAIQSLNMFNIDYDCILRTNCSTIINLKLLSNFIQSKYYKPYKIYTSEIFLTRWKSAPEDNSFTFRGNFMLFGRFYANLINSTSLEMLKQINNYNRIIHKSMFLYDDITIAGIFNTFIKSVGLDRYDIYQRMPTQYINSIYFNASPLYANTIAFFNKPFGETKDISEYYAHTKSLLDHFYENYYNILTDKVKKLNDDFEEFKYVEIHQQISDTEATIIRKSYDELKKED